MLKLLVRSFKGGEVGIKIERIRGGLAGKILKVDLSSKKISTEEMTGICCFMGSLSRAYALEPPDYAKLINSALGIDLTAEESCI